MSRGLGKLQREILDSLEASADTSRNLFYQGGECSSYGVDVRKAAWHGRTIDLPDGVYDVRAVSATLVRARGERFVPPAFGVSFTRATRSLIERFHALEPVYPEHHWRTVGDGELEPVWTFGPLDDPARQFRWHRGLRFERRPKR